MEISGAKLVIKLLEQQGIEIVCGIPGGSNLPIYDALRDSSIKHILARHEQGAGFMAQGMARTTGKAAVCMGTSGPGVTNLLTAIADARLDSIPVVAITGQVTSTLIGTDAFQEVDTYGLTIPITKHNFLVQSAADLLEIIPEAFRLAESGRPGPVVVDIPKDVQKEIIEISEIPNAIFRKPERAEGDAELIEKAVSMINNARRPIIYAGGGVVAADASADLLKFARRNSIPVVTTLMGLGAFPHGDSNYLGMLGMHGSRSTNMVMEEADLIIALGVRFDDRAVGKACEFCKHADILHIDIDRSEIGKIKSSNLSIVGDVGHVLHELVEKVEVSIRIGWSARIASIRMMYPDIRPDEQDTFHPLNLIRVMGETLPDDAIITTDVGQHQMWVAQGYPFRKPRTLLTSGGLGTMGFGLPNAIGAALAKPDKKVVCVSGDGSFLMNIQELATLAEQRLNVKVLIMNNNRLGLVRQQQELFFEERFFASTFESNPDFASIARGFGLPSFDLGEQENPELFLRKVLGQDGPCVINIPINFENKVLPMVPPECANREMIGG
ncbi:biosynthetic-type acetolactate synthase large subunit [Maridesulfovibrio salexigens]|uniref:Acetolactate synthase n=1 Tax=Maridesulfovibrio salexigens (strain ATCC 14822 / DSM 2638 / NCIMB 8403 / VKM B-1763) TaxID=526222 RepID=C6BTQ1_MARSD|nr:biosynthetic-type acetolactate synthase large subunit [Maridesulfovibrio salexigens]ACS79831.1 acetolactate synthase, large subunit, biosynthetic type [Maridesulfovibrio salexigens DSM 2638]